MPQQALEGGAFSPEKIKVMTTAFEEILCELKVVRTHPLAEVIWRIHGAFRSVFRSFSPSVTQLTC